jgi:predicted RNA-binding protein with PIN domain
MAEQVEPLWVVDGDNVAHVRGGSDEYDRVRADLIAAVVDQAARSGTDTVLVFDGHGADRTLGRTTVRYSKNETADTVIERLAHRRQHEREVTVVSSDTVLRHVAQRGRVHAMSAREYLDRLSAPPAPPSRREGGRQRFQLGDSVDAAVRDALERMRRGE